MRIAQFAPLEEAVPPQLYGGTERVVSYLTEELVCRGHDVTLFASGDSSTKAKLVPYYPRSLRRKPPPNGDVMRHVALLLGDLRSVLVTFDILHFHTDLLHLPVFRDMLRRTIKTVHLRAGHRTLVPVFDACPKVPLVSVSNSQRLDAPGRNWISTVYSGLPVDLLRFCDCPKGGYLAFLGRISPEKGADLAIEIARRAGMRIKLAAKVGDADKRYFEEVIRPLFDARDVEFLGEINDEQKRALLAHARALLFPISWPEPFGLVMIEAMSCGTPVIAFRRGSVPEVVESGVTGFVVDGVDDAVEAIHQVGELSRSRIRARFEARFSARRMADDYLGAYGLVARLSASETRRTETGP
jgi:glycosyltransferase involved in cell wall biosynthesis